VRAAAKLGMEVVPTLLLDHLSEAQKRAYILADNRLAELAGWDKEILAIELQNLLDIDIDFEITIRGGQWNIAAAHAKFDPKRCEADHSWGPSC
jgi:hypothetical protein